MVVITKIPNGDNGGDPNKKQQEEEKVKTSFSQLPHNLIEIIVARLRICDFPMLSIASKLCSDIICSPELYMTRSSLGVTEAVFYASVGFLRDERPSWYILHRNHVDDSLRLCKRDSLRPAFWGSAVVTIGPMMYIIGGSLGYIDSSDMNPIGRHIGNIPTSEVTLIDCRLNKYVSLPCMKRTRSRAVAGVIDGKIYVIGGCEFLYDNWVEVYDVNTKVWSDLPVSLPYHLFRDEQLVRCAVMDGKIYVLVGDTCFILDPSVGVLVPWDDGDSLRKSWNGSSCVVDDILYTFWPGCTVTPIGYYDPEAEEKRWRPVHGLDFWDSLPNSMSYGNSKMANLDGKLVILVGHSSLWIGHNTIWCLEISLIRREIEGDDFEMWGKVESVTHVFTSQKWPSIELSRTVTF